MLRFNSKEKWLTAVAECEISYWGYGCADAYFNGQLVGTWTAEYNCDNGQHPYGVLFVNLNENNFESVPKVLDF